MKHFVLAALFVSLCASAVAHAADAQHLVLGMGSRHCKSYLNSKDPMGKPLVYSWVQGAITGIDNSMVASTGKEILINKVTSGDTVISTFDGICRANPTMTIEAAANETYGALMKR